MINDFEDALNEAFNEDDIVDEIFERIKPKIIKEIKAVIQKRIYKVFLKNRQTNEMLSTGLIDDISDTKSKLMNEYINVNSIYFIHSIIPFISLIISNQPLWT